jgi:hypothetical protein
MAGNQILTISMITRAAVRIWKNTNFFIQNIGTQYDDQFARDGAKIGTALRIRLPNEYTVRHGAAAQPQDTNEQQIVMTLSTQDGVDVSFSSAERTMALDDYVERILAPKIAFLTADVAYTIMAGLEGSVANYVANVDGSGAVMSPTQFTVLRARAALMNNSAPPGQRKLVFAPNTGAGMVSTLSGLLNPAPAITRQYMEGTMYDALGFRWFEDQTVIQHVTGSFTAGAVAGAGQTGIATLVTAAISGTLNAGDFITIAGVNGINRLTRQSLGTLKQFVVTANVLNGATAIPIYPALVAPVGGVPVQYQTVTASPAAGAAISLVNLANEVYTKNIAYQPDAFTMATADMELPEGVWERSRAVFDGISMRSILAYNPQTDQAIDRLDVLFGFLGTRGEWAVAIADRP